MEAARGGDLAFIVAKYEQKYWEYVTPEVVHTL